VVVVLLFLIALVYIFSIVYAARPLPVGGNKISEIRDKIKRASTTDSIKDLIASIHSQISEHPTEEFNVDDVIQHNKERPKVVAEAKNDKEKVYDMFKHQFGSLQQVKDKLTSRITRK